MTDEQRKKYEEAINSITPTIDIIDEAHKEGKKEGWNEAIEVCAKIAWQYRHQIGSLSATLNDELQKLRK